MDIESIRHKALARYFLTGNAKGLDGKLVDRLRNMLNYIVNAGEFEELKLPPNFGLHPLKDNREGNWAMTVTKNWRMTFALVDETSIANLDLEDYH